VQGVNGFSELFTLALLPKGRFEPPCTWWVSLIKPEYVVVYLLFQRQ
jgi:hypothetical protein